MSTLHLNRRQHQRLENTCPGKVLMLNSCVIHCVMRQVMRAHKHDSSMKTDHRPLSSPTWAWRLPA